MTDTSQATSDRSAGEMTAAEAAALTERVIDNVEEVIVGQHDAVEHALVTVLARGHLLIEDVPGVGKTVLARSIAASLACSFKRVQFTPDLLPADVTGSNVFNQKTREFEFQPGPVFANVVLADEINRAPPKTQAALLEAMEEQQVTVDGDTRPLPSPFVVIATQNDVETGRTYDLPMAELDRFTKKLRLGYPEKAAETELLGQAAGDHPIESLSPVASVENLQRARAVAADIDAREPVRSYVVRLAAYTRANAELGASPRAALTLLRAAQARALLAGREYVIPDDIQTEAPTVLGHRVRATEYEDGETLVSEALSTVPVES